MVHGRATRRRVDRRRGAYRLLLRMRHEVQVDRRRGAYRLLLRLRHEVQG